VISGPEENGRARPQFAEKRPPIWMLAANILNKQSRRADTGWSSSLELTVKNISCYEMFMQRGKFFFSR